MTHTAKIKTYTSNTEVIQRTIFWGDGGLNSQLRAKNKYWATWEYEVRAAWNYQAKLTFNIS